MKGVEYDEIVFQFLGLFIFKLKSLKFDKIYKIMNRIIIILFKIL